MKRLALLCLLIAGCGQVHASSIRPARTKGKRPAAVKQVSTAAGETAPSAPQKAESSPAAASDPITEAARKAKEKQADKFDQRIIELISGDGPPPPVPPQPAPPGPPVPPVSEPFLSLPPVIEGDVGDFIEIVPHTNLKAVHFYVIDKGLKKLPDSISLASPLVTIVQSMAGGQYRMIAVGAAGDEIVGPVEFMVVVHGAPPPPAPVPPPAPPQPVNPTAAKLFIVTIDNVAARDPRTATVLTDMQTWNGFTAQGFQWKKLNITEPDAAKFKQMIDANNGIPCIVLLDATNYVPGQSLSLKWLNKNPADMKLPATPAGLQALVAKYTAR